MADPTPNDLLTLLKKAASYVKANGAADVANALHLDAGSRWLSSRNLITIGAVLALILLALRAMAILAPIVWPIVVLVSVCMVCRTITDAVTIRANGQIRTALAKNLSADGTLTDTEQAEIAKTTSG